jgi:hypothetical protein
VSDGVADLDIILAVRILSMCRNCDERNHAHCEQKRKYLPCGHFDLLIQVVVCLLYFLQVVVTLQVAKRIVSGENSVNRMSRSLTGRPAVLVTNSFLIFALTWEAAWQLIQRPVYTPASQQMPAGHGRRVKYQRQEEAT